MAHGMNKILLTSIIVYLPICLWGQSDTGYIRGIYDNLNQIKSASYFWYQSASILYDTIPSLSYRVYKKEFDNPDDIFVGASIASFQMEDTTKLVYFYDGKVQSYLDWENKTIPVDSFQNNRYPFRKVYPPFFTHVKCLLKYALETSDKKIIQVNDFADSVLIRLYVYDKLVEVVGNRIVYADPPDLTEDKWTKYDIWINKMNNLPYRLIKRFPDRVCWEVCKDIKINTTDKKSFVASEYFPPDFAVKFNENKKTNEKNLIGTVAPGWKLKDTDNNEIALIDLKSKVLLIQFTGIGCGPCYQSISSLIIIRNQYKLEEFDIISIETWNNDISVINKHISANRINYKYLIGNSEVKLKYGIQSVPKFFVLDKKRVIRKIITGFDKEKTYIEFKEIIDQLINE
jgi:thiol-disulfide isomerase/thioredoxin